MRCARHGRDQAKSANKICNLKPYAPNLSYVKLRILQFAQGALSGIQSMETHLCAACSAINPRQPYHGPERLKSGNGLITRIFYSYSDSLDHITISAEEEQCDMCYLFLQAMRNADAVDPQWEYSAELFDEFSDPENANTAAFGVSVTDMAYFEDMVSGDIDNPEGPVLISITFRNRRIDEAESRCIDVAVHWTDPVTVTRRVSHDLVLVSSLPGE